MTPTDRLYHKDHLWVRQEGENEAWIGVTHHAQDSLGEVVYIECAEVGTEIRQGISFGIIESVKVMSDLISPVSGTVLSVNDMVSADPCCINRDPYMEGWLLKVKIADISELSGLMTAENYERHVKGS
ncbi:glycine cleavage system H protein [Sulfuriferula plumbiphila]|uniref:Glycine cleavage system H protein n=1 Tax=Sulfuriferula plumbiphila TaxID=171865 RepID=A0A512LC45_9PROT|nr:glycine cleavage system protein GcvH [Sulfuriferula plumbiphila]BBP04215.1 glycine cleavage system H protein [Sulfuriferula plumbiphila]GEP32057.1 glycine cleavage system H protein [Sulfuriferula plumbiphila]